MRIWIDADSCPVTIRELLYRAAKRTQTELVFVANRRLKLPASSLIRFLLVPSGPDVADNTILEQMSENDLVITYDIPLAAKVIEKGGLCINSRGDIYSCDNIREKLSTRNFMDDLRASGIETSGPPALSKRDIQQFANSLDQTLTRYYKAL